MMKQWLVCAAAAAIATGACAYDKQAPEPENVPELLVTEKGERVTTVAEWENVRRPEIYRTMMERVYGVRPQERPNDLRFEQVGETEEVYGGKALKKI